MEDRYTGPAGRLAFASYRNGSLAEEATASAGQGCVFIGPPHFRPEPVASRAIALAAARGAFQTGFYNEKGEEVTFPNVTAVAEFVRRAFVRGGGGDESGGGGPEFPPPEPPSDMPPGPLVPDGVERRRDGPSLLREFEGSLKKFGYQTRKLKTGKSSETPWASERKSDFGNGKITPFYDGPDLLAMGAIRLIHELLRGMPRASDAPALQQWRLAAIRLGRLIERVGVYPLLFSARYFPVLANSFWPIIARIRGGEFPGWDQSLDREPNDDEVLAILLELLFRSGFPLDADGAELNRLAYWRYQSFWWFDSGRASSEGDPISDLASLPCPEGFEKVVGHESGKPAGASRQPASLYNLLTAFLGSPLSAEEASADVDSTRALIEIMLFAGAAIVGHEGAPLLRSRRSWWGGSISASETIALANLAGETWSWLKEHLPQLAFSREVEAAIGAASGLRYHRPRG